MECQRDEEGGRGGGEGRYPTPFSGLHISMHIHVHTHVPYTHMHTLTQETYLIRTAEV